MKYTLRLFIEFLERCMDRADHGEYVMLNRCPILYRVGVILHMILLAAISLPFIIVLAIVGRFSKL